MKIGDGFDKGKLFLIDGAHHVVFCVSEICQRKRVNRQDIAQVEKEVASAICLVSKVVTAEQERNEAFSFNRFFKDTKTKTKIAAAVLNDVNCV